MGPGLDMQNKEHKKEASLHSAAHYQPLYFRAAADFVQEKLSALEPADEAEITESDVFEGVEIEDWEPKEEEELVSSTA